MNKKNLLHNPKFQAAILAAVAVLFLILVFFAGKSMVLMAIWIALSISAFLISCILLIEGLREGSTRYNYFLYDKKSEKNRRIEDLTFPIVNDALTTYLSSYVAKPVELWNGIPKNLQAKLEEQTMFRVPVTFRMLYELSLLSADEIVERFSYVDVRTVAQICRNLKGNGNEEMADIIFNMKRQTENEKLRIVNFFTKNKRFFEGQIFGYVKRNIGAYVMEK